MGLIYIKFNMDTVVTDANQPSANRFTRSLENVVQKVASTIIPAANPDFDGKIDDVHQWLLEVDDEDGTPQREIGLDDKGSVMMIMPWKKNCGFWTDSHVRVDDLAKSYTIQFVDQLEFEKLWSRFENQDERH